MSKKTLAFTIYNLTSGGAERVLTTLANEFAETYDVLIITLTECGSFYPLKEGVKLLNCGLPTSSKGPFGNLIAYYRTIKKLKNILSTNKVGTVISFTTTVNIFSIIAARRAKVKCIVSERNNPYLRIPSMFWKTLRNWSYKKANALVVQTEASVSFFSKLISPTKIHILANPLSPDVIAKRSLPKEIGKSKTILNVGRLDRNKAQDVLIKAFAGIAADEWKIQLVGDGDQMENYKKLTRDLNIENQVEFLGNRKNVWDYYANSEIFVFTSRSEGFPNALTEALYFGLPCISTNCPNGPSELINNNSNGFLIQVDDQEDLEKRLSLLINDVNLRQRFSDDAIKMAKGYETKTIVDKWRALIYDISDN